jgi:hypothetical protein
MSTNKNSDLTNGRNNAKYNDAYAPCPNSCNNIMPDFTDITFAQKIAVNDKINEAIKQARQNLTEGE